MAKAQDMTSKEDAVRSWLLRKLDGDNLAPDIAQRVISSYVALTALQDARNKPAPSAGSKS